MRSPAVCCCTGCGVSGEASPPLLPISVWSVIFCCGGRCSQFSFSKNFSICSCRFGCIRGQDVFLCSGSYYTTILDPPPQIILYSVIMRHLGKISRIRCYEIVTLNNHPLLDSLLFLLFLLCAISLIFDQEHIFYPVITIIFLSWLLLSSIVYCVSL